MIKSLEILSIAKKIGFLILYFIPNGCSVCQCAFSKGGLPSLLCSLFNYLDKRT